MALAVPQCLDKVHAVFRQAAGLLIAAYEPVGKLPPGWAYQDPEKVANLLCCGGGGSLTCQVCEEIRYAVVANAASPTVAEWRALG
jgi:hypothetical protein